MIKEDDPALQWSVKGPDDKGMVTVTVRHPDVDTYPGWAYRTTEEEARSKALARLNYAADGYGLGRK